MLQSRSCLADRKPEESILLSGSLMVHAGYLWPRAAHQDGPSRQRGCASCFVQEYEVKSEGKVHCCVHLPKGRVTGKMELVSSWRCTVKNKLWATVTWREILVWYQDKIFIKVIEHWNGLPREAVDSWRHSKLGWIWLHLTLSKFEVDPALYGEVPPDNSEVPFNLSCSILFLSLIYLCLKQLSQTGPTE